MLINQNIIINPAISGELIGDNYNNLVYANEDNIVAAESNFIITDNEGRLIASGNVNTRGTLTFSLIN